MTTLMRAPATVSHTALRILVVEDNTDSQQLVCELLRVLGHVPAAVESAELAVGALAQQPFEVLFTDVRLPGMSGLELARQSSATYPALKIIFASGYGVQIRKNIDVASFCLPKPYDVEQLQEILQEIGLQLFS